jgi:hypothetical protein
LAKYVKEQRELEKNLEIEVPSGKNHTYLRMGDSPEDDTALYSVKVGDVFEGLPHLDKMSAGFIHGAEKNGNLDKFVQVGGWYDHTDGNRLTTTAQNKVEIIKGDYKLITCNGEAGIDFSGGHLRMWSKTPGSLSKVINGSNHGATEVLESDIRYSFRFLGGAYDESWNGTHYESYYGVKSPHSFESADPPGASPTGERRLALYKEEIHAEVLHEIFEIGRMLTKRRAQGLLWNDDEALEFWNWRKGTIAIKDKDEVLLSKAEREISPWAVEDKVSAAGTSIEQRVTPLGTTTVYLGPGHSQEFYGASYSDRIMASSRSAYSFGSSWFDIRRYDTQQQLDASDVRVDMFLGALWLDVMVAGFHFEARGLRMSTCLYGVNVVDLKVEKGLLHLLT